MDKNVSRMGMILTLLDEGSCLQGYQESYENVDNHRLYIFFEHRAKVTD